MVLVQVATVPISSLHSSKLAQRASLEEEWTTIGSFWVDCDQHRVGVPSAVHDNSPNILRTEGFIVHPLESIALQPQEGHIGEKLSDIIKLLPKIRVIFLVGISMRKQDNGVHFVLEQCNLFNNPILILSFECFPLHGILNRRGAHDMKTYKQSTLEGKGEILRTELLSPRREGNIPVVVEVSKISLP